MELGDIANDVAGLPKNESDVRNLIKANSSLTDPGAVLSINLEVPPPFSPTEVSELTIADLKAAREEWGEQLEKTLRAGGIKMTQFHGFHLDKFGSNPAVVTEYEREGVVSLGDFIVQVNQIALPDKTIKLTMSYRLQDAFIWKARMARIRKSFAVQ